MCVFVIINCWLCVFSKCISPLLSLSLLTLLSNNGSHLTLIFQSGAVYCASVADCAAGGLPDQDEPGLLSKELPLLNKNPKFSWIEDIGPPESGHDPLSPNEIEPEGVWGDSRRPRRRRRRPKSRQSSSSKPFTLSPEFVEKFISSPPTTPSSTIWDVSSDPWWAYNDHSRKTHSDPRRTKSDLWRTPVGPQGDQSDSNQYSSYIQLDSDCFNCSVHRDDDPLRDVGNPSTHVI